MPPIDPMSLKVFVIASFVGFAAVLATYGWAAGKARKAGREFNERIVPILLTVTAAAAIGASVFANEGIIRWLLVASALMLVVGAALTLCSSRYRMMAAHRHQYDNFAPTVLGAVSAMFGPQIVTLLRNISVAAAVAAGPQPTSHVVAANKLAKSVPESTLVSGLDVTAARTHGPAQVATPRTDEEQSSPDRNILPVIFTPHPQRQPKLTEPKPIERPPGLPKLDRVSNPQIAPTTVQTVKVNTKDVDTRAANLKEEVDETATKMVGVDLAINDLVSADFTKEEARLDANLGELPFNSVEYNFSALKAMNEITPKIFGLRIPTVEVPGSAALPSLPRVFVHP